MALMCIVEHDLRSTADHQFLPTVDLRGTCTAFLYRANNDGALLGGLDANVTSADVSLSNSAASVVNTYWTGPCAAGVYSGDGLEHGITQKYVDLSGQTIGANDPTCWTGQEKECSHDARVARGLRYLFFKLPDPPCRVLHRTHAESISADQ